MNEPTVIEAVYLWKQEKGDRFTFNLMTPDGSGDQADVFFHTDDEAKFRKGGRYRVTIEELPEE